MNDLGVKLSEAYKEHTCFKELEDMKEFYDNTSDRSYLVVHLGTKRRLKLKLYLKFGFSQRLTLYFKMVWK